MESGYFAIFKARNDFLPKECTDCSWFEWNRDHGLCANRYHFCCRLFQIEHLSQYQTNFPPSFES